MTNSEKNELRSEFSRLISCQTLDDSFELLDVYSELLYQLILRHHKEPVSNSADADAKMVLQMIFTKTLQLKNIAKGISFNSKNGTKLNRIIDPTIMTMVIRNIYETIGTFNLIYRNTKTKDEKTILYCLWVHSGLKYRQRFEGIATTDENKIKMNEEKQQLVNLKKIIEDTKLYKKLDEENKSIIQKKLKDKSFLIKFENSKVIPLHWQELTKTLDFKKELYNNIYTYFSLHTHPSNVAVFQFSDMFDPEKATFLILANINLQHYFRFTSVFIADYLNLFQNALETFNNLDIRDQIVIDFHNIILRGNKYSINNSWEIIN